MPPATGQQNGTAQALIALGPVFVPKLTLFGTSGSGQRRENHLLVKMILGQRFDSTK
jgi:hypothetical protein